MRSFTLNIPQNCHSYFCHMNFQALYAFFSQWIQIDKSQAGVETLLGGNLIYWKELRVSTQRPDQYALIIFWRKPASEDDQNILIETSSWNQQFFSEPPQLNYTLYMYSLSLHSVAANLTTLMNLHQKLTFLNFKHFLNQIFHKVCGSIHVIVYPLAEFTLLKSKQNVM